MPILCDLQASASNFKQTLIVNSVLANTKNYVLAVTCDKVKIDQLPSITKVILLKINVKY